MPFSRIIIVGAGAIGSAYGAFLSTNNHVILIGRAAHMDAIKANGLTVRGDGEGTYTLETATKLKEIPSKTLLIISVKAYDLHETLLELQPLTHDDTVLLFLQNGLGIEDIIKHALMKGNALRAIVTMGSEILKPGFIRVRLNPTILDSDNLSKEITRVFQDCGLTTINSEAFLTEIWRKATINCVVNPLSAILQAKTYELLSPHLNGIRKSIVEECIAVAAKEEVELDLNLLQIMNQSLPLYENRTSMFQDIFHGKPTEIEFLNGKIVEKGKSYNVSTPVNEVLVQLVRFMESVQR